MKTTFFSPADSWELVHKSRKKVLFIYFSTNSKKKQCLPKARQKVLLLLKKVQSSWGLLTIANCKYVTDPNSLGLLN